MHNNGHYPNLSLGAAVTLLLLTGLIHLAFAEDQTSPSRYMGGPG